MYEVAVCAVSVHGVVHLSANFIKPKVTCNVFTIGSLIKSAVVRLNYC